MNRLVTFSLLTAFALSSCAGPESDWFYGELKPKMESHLRYMLTPDEISDDAAPEEYFVTGEYDGICWTEGSTEYYNVTCVETGEVYEVWKRDSGRIMSYGYSLTPVEH